MVLANVSGDFPFIPVITTDQSGNPVPGVVADFFYPAAGLTPDDLRDFDHQAADARGVFFDATTTNEAAGA